VACTSRHAPVSDKLRTEHGRCAFLPRIMVPDLSIRLRGGFSLLGHRLQTLRSNLLLKTWQRLIAIEFAIKLGLGGHTSRRATTARNDLANGVAEYEADSTC
jgi:hypothetical protein